MIGRAKNKKRAREEAEVIYLIFVEEKIILIRKCVTQDYL